MRSTIFSVLAVVGTVVAAGDSADSFDKDTAPEGYSSAANIVTQISDGKDTTSATT